MSWLTKNQYLIATGSEESVPTNQRSKAHTRLKNKLSDVPQMLEVLSSLSVHLTAEETDRIQNETNPYHLGNFFGRTYSPEQRRDMIYALLQQEPGYMDDPAGTISQISGELAERAEESGDDFETLRAYSRARKELFDHLQSALKRQRRETGVQRPISRRNFAEWVVDEGDSKSNLVHLPRLIEPFLNKRSASSALEKYTSRIDEILSSLQEDSSFEGATDAHGEGPVHIHEPANDGIRGSRRVLTSLSGEFTHAVQGYWTARRILERDSLLTHAQEWLHDGHRQSHDYCVLEWVDRSQPVSEWTGHHTRRANMMANETPPLLSVVGEGKSRPNKYERTAYGQFILAMRKYEGQHGEYRGYLTDFSETLDISNDVVDDSLLLSSGVSE